MNVRNWYSKLVFLALLSCSGMVFAAGNADAGKAQAAACGACHGQDGASGIDPTYPNLAGQHEKYLFGQLKMIQDNSRNIALMAGQLNGKSDQDLADLAAYFASLPAKNSQASGDDEALAKAASIYRAGIAAKGVAACSACHSPNGTGNELAGFPRLGGQSAAYIIAQLKAYRENMRTTDESVGGMMRGVAAGLTDTEMALVADYIQGLN